MPSNVVPSESVTVIAPALCAAALARLSVRFASVPVKSRRSVPSLASSVSVSLPSAASATKK
jgi:hypothetical protein